jgi:hypothetical protein
MHSPDRQSESTGGGDGVVSMPMDVIVRSENSGLNTPMPSTSISLPVVFQVCLAMPIHQFLTQIEKNYFNSERNIRGNKDFQLFWWPS